MNKKILIGIEMTIVLFVITLLLPVLVFASYTTPSGGYSVVNCLGCRKDTLTKATEDSIARSRENTTNDSYLSDYYTKKVKTFCAPGVNNPEKCTKYCKDLAGVGGKNNYCGSATNVQDMAKKKAAIEEENKKKAEEDEAKKKAEEDKKQLEELQKKEDGIKMEFENLSRNSVDLIKKQDSYLIEVRSKGKIKTFLVGSDYKNIGQLRSQLALNESCIKKINDLLGDTQSEENKNLMQQQLNFLTEKNAEINQVILENEDKFSLFGWAVKFFNK